MNEIFNNNGNNIIKINYLIESNEAIFTSLVYSKNNDYLAIL